MFKNTLRDFLQEDFPISFIWNPFLHDLCVFVACFEEHVSILWFCKYAVATGVPAGAFYPLNNSIF